jgi:two-component system OmpR family sensor kinase
MRKQFVLLYLVLLCSSALLLWSLSQFYQHLTQDKLSYQLDIEQIFDTRSLQLQSLDKSSLYLPPELESLLQQGEVIAVDLPSRQSLYYRQGATPNQVLQLGPLATTQQTPLPWLDLLIYGGLALLFLFLLLPLFRDIKKLSSVTLAFANQPSELKAGIEKHSSLYPLASSVEKMASQIHRLLSFNQDMSRTIAHEARTPLARMKFTLGLTHTQLEEKHRQRLIQDIEEIDALVSNYLDFSRIEVVKEQKPQQMQTSVWLKELADKFDVYQSELQLSFESPLDYFEALPAPLLLAAQNLVSNALRYAHSEIRVTLCICEQKYCLQVQDDGPGLSEHPDMLQRLFRRGDNSSGFGLGLYIVAKVAEWHKGELDISNTSGACIRLLWPKASPAVDLTMS